MLVLVEGEYGSHKWGIWYHRSGAFNSYGFPKIYAFSVDSTLILGVQSAILLGGAYGNTTVIIGTMVSCPLRARVQRDCHAHCMLNPYIRPEVSDT